MKLKHLESNISKYYIVDYTSNYTNSDCQCNDICRCGRYENITVTSVDLDRLISEVVPKGTEKDSIEYYFVDRVFRAFKLWSGGLYTPIIHGGYYGQEIGGFELDTSMVNDVNKHIAWFNKLKPTDGDYINKIVEHLLILEYGYLLPRIEDKPWEVVKLSPKDVVIGNDSYHKKVDIESFYRGWGGILGVVLYSRVDNYYRLIDGYHRSVANQNAKTGTYIVTYDK